MTHWSERHAIVPAAYVIFERDGKILLMRRAGDIYMSGYYNVPAGHVDDNEGAKAAGVREAFEEVGLTVAQEDLTFVHCMVYRGIEGDHDRVNFFFKATTFSGEPKNCEPEKCDEIVWVSPDNLPEEMVWEAAHVFKQLTQGNMYSEVGFTKESHETH